MTYLSDKDLKAAVDNGQLIVNRFDSVGPTSIDLHLDDTSQAKVWDIGALAQENSERVIRSSSGGWRG